LNNQAVGPQHEAAIGLEIEPAFDDEMRVVILGPDKFDQGRFTKDGDSEGEMALVDRVLDDYQSEPFAGI
jgi:hypothetical protein